MNPIGIFDFGFWLGRSNGRGFKQYEATARSLKIPLESLPIRASNLDFDGASRVAAQARANALITFAHIIFNPYRKEIAALAIKHRFPSMGKIEEYANEGGLMSYAADEGESYSRAAWYVDRILKGSKPAELPVEQPTKFELVISLKTAKQSGLPIPPNVLTRADKVIR